MPGKVTEQLLDVAKHFQKGRRFIRATRGSFLLSETSELEREGGAGKLSSAKSSERFIHKPLSPSLVDQLSASTV